MRRTRLMGQEPKGKTISQSTFEALCRKACSSPPKPERDETVKDVYWRSIRQEVSRYLFPNSPVRFLPTEGASRESIYQNTLAFLVFERWKKPFNAVEIARPYIDEALGIEKD